MTGIKFCGLRTREDVDIVNSVGADYAGFIVTPGFGRSVGESGIRELAPHVRKGIVPAGVFVDDDPELIARLANDGVIGLIQLHGSEDNGYIERLKGITGVPVVRSFVVGTEEDIGAVNACAADLVLLDSGKGTGRTFDWSILGGVKREFILAGGLDADNVSEAIRKVHPMIVDTSSRMETDGAKDFIKVKAFADAVRATDEAGRR